MEHIFEGVEEIFGNNDSRYSKVFVLASQIFIGIIILSQNIQMFWYPNSQLSDWNELQTFWEFVSLLSIDNIAISFGFMSECIIAILSTIVLTILSLICIILMKYLEWNIPSIVIFISKHLHIVLCEIYFIASVKILIAVIKYSSLEYQIIEEYPTNNLKVFNLGIGGEMIACIILLLLLIILTVIYNAASCDIRQPLNNSITTAKSRAIISQISSNFYCINALMYFFIGYNYYQVYLISLIILYSIITGYYIYYLPFYSEILNFWKIFFHLDCVLIISSFWVGYLLDNGDVSFLVTIMMQIILLILTHLILKYRISKISLNHQAIYNKFEIFELSIRKLLKSGELEEELITKMNKNFRIHRDKLNIVTQAYYCSDVLLNEGLAYNKIIGIKYKGLNVFTNFQVYKCRKAIMSQCKNLSIERIRLYQYFIDLEKLKSDDISFCERYSKFSKAIIEPNPNLSKLKDYIDEIVDSKRDLINLYESILTAFPSSEEVNEMYGSFLINILCDINKGQFYLTKKKSENNANSLKQTFIKVNDRGYLIFSGNIQDIGKAIYANKAFLNFMNIPRDLIKTYFFSNFLPKLYSKEHTLLLKTFLNNITENVVYKSLPLFLVNYNGYLSEYFITLECIADQDSINFLCSIDPIHSGRRELAIIDLNGFIYSHSKDFISILGYNEKNAEGINIQYYIPDIIITELIIDSIYEKMYTNTKSKAIKTIGIVLKCCKIREITIYVLYITDDMNQLNSWKSEKNFYDIEGINKKYFISEIQQIEEEEEKLDEEKEIKAVSKHLLQLPDENNKNFMEKIDKENLLQSKVNNHSSSGKFIDNYDIKAAEKSKTVLRVARVLLFISVTHI